MKNLLAKSCYVKGKNNIPFREVGPYDLALFRVDSLFSFSESVQPIALPAANSPPNENRNAVLSGWGRTSSTNYPSILQYVEIPVLSYERK